MKFLNLLATKKIGFCLGKEKRKKIHFSYFPFYFSSISFQPPYEYQLLCRIVPFATQCVYVFFFLHTSFLCHKRICEIRFFASFLPFFPLRPPSRFWTMKSNKFELRGLRVFLDDRGRGILHKTNFRLEFSSPRLSTWGQYIHGSNLELIPQKRMKNATHVKHHFRTASQGRGKKSRERAFCNQLYESKKHFFH